MKRVNVLVSFGPYHWKLAARLNLSYMKGFIGQKGYYYHLRRWGGGVYGGGK